MKYFKTKATYLSPRYEISPAIFEQVTKHKFPFEQISQNKRVSLYGICPSCLNSIQLIGMSKETKINPYGKHTGKDIDGFFQWNQLKYECCPYAVPEHHREINEDDLLPEITEDVIELYELLKNNFDRVVYVVQKAFDIYCSTNFWKNVLKQYLVNNAYMYPWLTESNLPYIFALRGMTHNSVYGQQVKLGSKMYEELKKYKYIKFDIPKYRSEEYRIIFNNGTFLNIEFRFTEHKQKARDGQELKESVRVCIDNITSGETIFEDVIEFDETYFMNIVNRTENEKYRNQKLLDIAKELMPPLIK